MTVIADAAHKAAHAPVEHRLAMARLGFAELGAVVELEEHRYTVDALEAYGYEDPIFLLGADQLAAFPTWKEPERVLELARLGVAARPGYAPRSTTRIGSSCSSSSRTTSRPRRSAPASTGRADRRPGRAGGRRVHRRARPLRRGLTASDTGTLNPLSSLEHARRIAALAAEKLAEDVVILDMRPVCVYTDFFVLATGRNARQTVAVFDEVHARLKKEAKLLPRAVDGQQQGDWIIADYLDVVLHVFTPETRAYYRLEDLWGDVPAVDVEAATA